MQYHHNSTKHPYILKIKSRNVEKRQITCAVQQGDVFSQYIGTGKWRVYRSTHFTYAAFLCTLNNHHR